MPHVIDNALLNEDDIEYLRSQRVNGKSRGNIVYIRDIQPPRLDDAYLRYSVPLFHCRNAPKKLIRRETIYIVPNGGVFYSEFDYPSFIDKEEELFTLKLYQKDYPDYALKFIASFLKSTFMIWYCLNAFEDTNLYRPKIFYKLLLPKLNTNRRDVKARLERIDMLFEQIIDCEKRFLIDSQAFKGDEFTNFAASHNNTIAPLAYEIDAMIYDLLEVSPDEKDIIESNLKMHDIYLPKTTSDNQG